MQLKNNSKQLFPLDCVAGIIDADTLDTTKITPAVQLHIQKHPQNEHHNVNVMTFSNYLTKKFSEKSLSEIDNAKFYDYGGRKFLRVATQKPEDDETANEFQKRHPGVTFGNANSTIRVFESDASGGMTSSEEQFLIVSQVFFELLWQAKHFLIEFALVPTLHRTVGMVKAAEAEQHAQTQTQPETQPLLDTQTQTAVHIHRNFPDSTVTLLSEGNSYSLHSDTDPFKPENWGPSRPKESMTIFTHSLIALADATNEQDNQREALVNTKVATIVHGTSETEPCEYLGCFSSSDESWRKAENDSDINLIGASHGHMQFSGSQGSMCHKIAPTESFKIMKQSRRLARVVMSHRSLRNTINHRDIEFAKRDANLLNNSLQAHRFQKYTNCLSNVLGNGTPIEIVENQGVTTTTDSNSAAAADSASAPTATVKTKKHVFHSMLNKLKNGTIYPPEEINRKRIIGLPPSVSEEKIATNAVTAFKLTALGITLSFTSEKSKRQQIVGPLVEEDADGSVYLKKPGTITNPNHLDNFFDIRSNSHHDDVFDGVNTFHFRRPGKNGSGLTQNVHTVLTGKGKLVGFWAGCYGGAASLAGVYPPDISLISTDKYVPTHLVSPGQKVSSTGMMQLFQLVEGQVVCNVFFNGLYVGPFFAKEFHCQSLSPEDIRAEKDSMLVWLKKIRDEFEDLSNKIKLGSADSDAMDRELQTLSSSAVTLLFVPLIPDFLEKWKKSSRVRWDVLQISQDDIVRPKIYLPKEGVKDYYGSTKLYNGWQSVLNFGQSSWLPMLEETKLVEMGQTLQEKVNRHDPILDETQTIWNPIEQRVMEVTGREISDGIQKEIAEIENGEDHHLESHSNSTREYQWDDFLHCLFFAAASALFRSRKCVSKDELGIMNPPRMLLDDWGCELDTATNVKTYENNLQESSLKIFILRGIHASTFSPDKDPVAALVSIATGCFSEDVGGWRSDGSPKARNGKDFVLDQRNQILVWEIFFKATICTFFQPSFLIQLYVQIHSKLEIMSGDHRLLVPSPQQAAEVKAFIMELQKFKWVKSRCIHPIFVDSFSEMSTLCTFINLLVEKGLDIFQSAAIKGGRREAVKYLRQRFESDLSLALTPFQASVIIRSIEICIHDPLGPPDNILLGYGSNIGAKCFTTVFDCDAQEVPSKIVERLNRMAKEKKDQRTLDYFSVLGLMFEASSDCLVHKLGLQKKFNEVDVEHALCMFATTVALTLPEQNNQIKRSPSIDGRKSFPISYAPQSKSAIAKKYNEPVHTMPILKQLFTYSEEEEEAYRRRVRNKSFVLRKEIFSADVV
eukprot:scaffold9184_cov72-Skeletonema_dohrnii-CCMP3373.AAC.1